MKVIHVSRYSKTGGAAIAGTRIYQATLEHGVVSDRLVGEEELIIPKIKSSFIQILLYPFRIKKGLLSLNLFNTSILNKINNSDADLVHLHWINDEMISIEDIGKIKKPVIWTFHDMWPFTGAEHYTDDSFFKDGYAKVSKLNKFYFYFNKWTWLRKERSWKNQIQIVVPSHWLFEKVKQSKLMQNQNVKVIPNPIDINVWTRENKKASRKALNLPNDKFLILFGAQDIDNPVKGFDLLKDSLKHLKLYMNDFILIVFGKRKKEIDINNTCKIIYLDFLNDEKELRKLFSAVDVFAAPSRLEAFGQVASESQACGTPVVAFNNSGLADVVSHLKTGYLAKSFDTQDFANGFKWVNEMLRSDKRAKLSEACINHIRKTFSYDKVGKVYSNTYLDIIREKSEKKNILHVNRYLSFGGAAEAFNRINSALSSNKKYRSYKLIGSINATKSRNLIFSLSPFTGNIRSTIAQFLIRVLMFGSKNMRSISIFPTQTLSKINNSECDIVHLHWINDEMISIEDIGKIKKPVIWTFHDMWPFCGAEHITESERFKIGYQKEIMFKNKTYFDIDRWTWLRKERSWKNQIQIVVPSHWLFEKVKQSKLMQNQNVKVIPNPIDTNTWYPVSKEESRNFLKLPQDIPIILFGASEATDFNKGLDLLSDSLGLLKKEGINFKCVIFGKASKDKLKRFDFPYIFLDYISDPTILRSVYNAADVFACPSRLETFGQTASESQACGTPVVAFNNSGLTEVILHLKTGYLAESFNINDFTQGIKWVFNSLDENNYDYNLKESIEKKIKSNARDYIHKNFSYSVISDKYEKLYDDVCNIK